MGDPLESWAVLSPRRSNSPYSPSLSPFSGLISSSLISLNPSLSHVDADLWIMAERRAQEIICTIQPAVVSDSSRQGIIGFLQSLIKDQFGVEAFPFGSVPLKTYLPDGDIDLTVVSRRSMEKDLVMGIYNALVEQGEQNPQFQITHVNYVQAQVKVVKCEVMNMSVDISFNQMEGLSALCFFEQIDQLVGRGHLFKRSIILVKAWCYYESRTLGAQSGLLSTYAIEVLVLYIINHFHQSVVGPLSVLYKFLDYYGKFDWDNYCVSLDGPVPISSLPNILVEPLPNNLLLSRDFLDYCKMLYSIPIQAVEVSIDTFPVKCLNIIDPLKVNNNLGRSVAKGSAKRIRYALLGGFKKLRAVFMEPGVSMGVGIEDFFINTLERNGKGQRMDAKVPVSVFGTGKSEASDLSGDFILYYRSLLSGQLYHGYAMPHMVQLVPRPPVAARFQITNPWNVARQLGSRNVHRNIPQGPPIIFVPAPLFPYHVTPQQTAPFVHFRTLQNLPRSRGTGTYIPHTGYYAHGHRLAPPIRRDDVPMNSSAIVQSPLRTRMTRDTPGTSRFRNGNEASSSKTERRAPITASKPLPTVAPTPQVSQPALLALETAETNSANLEFGGSSKASTSLSALPSSSAEKQEEAGPSGSKDDEEKSDAGRYQLEDRQEFPPL